MRSKGLIFQQKFPWLGIEIVVEDIVKYIKPREKDVIKRNYTLFEMKAALDLGSDMAHCVLGCKKTIASRNVGAIRKTGIWDTLD